MEGPSEGLVDFYRFHFVEIFYGKPDHIPGPA
jgi:hypothetical protein